MGLSEAARFAIEAARLRVLSRDNPLLSTLPEKFQEFRPQQTRAIEQIMDAFRGGQKVVVLEGPPGSGKTLIAETVRKLLRTRGLYVCTTKSLQEQFRRDFDYARVIQGRVNYPTELYPQRFGNSWQSITCADCTKQSGVCKWCSSTNRCPYEQAKAAAYRSDLLCTNTAYFLTEANRAVRDGQRALCSGWPLVVVDEADLLAGELLRMVTLTISEKRAKRYGISAPEKVSVQESWMEWARDVRPVLGSALAAMPLLSSNVQEIRERKWLEGAVRTLELVEKGVEEGGWIYTGDRERIEFKPVWVDELGERFIWRHGARFLLMSGTVISAGLRLQELGWGGEYGFVGMESGFEVKNRRVVVRPVANVTFKTKGEAYGLVRGEIERILAQHNSTESVLVHCVSYELARYLCAEVRTTRQGITYDSAGERDSQLARFRATPGAVLYAPSMDRGIDLAGESCRVQVIAKVPYPNTGDKQVAARLYGGGRRGQNWYNLETVSTIIQMCGRAVRSRDDWAVTYILDRQFVENLWARARPLFPVWWREGLVWE